MRSRGSHSYRAAVAVAAIALLASACSTSSGTQTSQKPSAELVIGAHDQGTTYVRNYNVYSPATERAPYPGLIYEPLLRIDYSQGGEVKPWLADSWKFDSTATAVTFTLRDDVTWSDGKPLTAEDVAFSLNLPLANDQVAPQGNTYKSVEAVDNKSVTVHFETPAFNQLEQFANPQQLRIVPKHVWAEQDLGSWTNPDPVGTGPYKLDAFAAQQVTLAARDDYWGGKLPVPTLKIVATNADSVKAQLQTGQVDWASVAWNRAKDEFVAKDPQHHLYDLYATGTNTSIIFNTAKPPFDDVHVRRALSFTADRTAVVTTLERPGTEANPTGLSEQVHGDWLAPEYRGVKQNVDAKAAQAELAAGGYTVQDGALAKGGKRYEVSLSSNADYGWQDLAAVMANTWQKTLGLNVKNAALPSATLFDQQLSGKFDMTVDITGTFSASVYGLYRMLDSQFVKPIGAKAASNKGRWNDPETDALLAQMAGTDDVAKLKPIGQQLQKIIVDEVPFSPVYNAYSFVPVNATRWTGWPSADSFESVPAPGGGPNATLTLLHLKPAGQ